MSGGLDADRSRRDQGTRGTEPQAKAAGAAEAEGAALEAITARRRIGMMNEAHRAGSIERME